MAKKIICFGEMLWDVFPDAEIAGGAPLNVAIHLKQLGCDVELISKVGKDSLGEGLIAFCKSFDLSTRLIQTDDLRPTGKVIVDNSQIENIKYDIVFPAAWDYITIDGTNLKAVEAADLLIFGSLGIRNEVTWQSLQTLVKQPLIKVFDINLRAPYIDFQKIDTLLQYTNILKINEDEMEILTGHYGVIFGPDHSAFDFCKYFADRFSLNTICITLGGKGAMIYQNGEIIHHEGYKVVVKDTVGAGDAFLGGFVKMYLEGKSPEEIIDFSCSLGAYVASQKGGTPRYDPTQLNGIKRT